MKTVLECVKNAKRKVLGGPGSGNFKHGGLKGMQGDKGGGGRPQSSHLISTQGQPEQFLPIVGGI